MGTSKGKPLGVVKVIDCGQIVDDKKDNLIESEKGITFFSHKTLIHSHN